MVNNPDVVDFGGASMGHSTTIATSLLLRLKGGDPEAWRRLTSLFGPEVYRWCRKAGLQAEDAADVGQEVFQAVALHVESFQRERPGDTFRGWLWTIAQNKLRDHWRRRRDRPDAEGGTDAQQRLAEWPEEDSSTSCKSPPLGAAVARRAVEVIRAEFEDRTWQAFWRVSIEGHAAAEVARELGVSLNAVYIARSRVLKRLRDEIGDSLV